jgi:hypothetical protein
MRFVERVHSWMKRKQDSQDSQESLNDILALYIFPFDVTKETAQENLRCKQEQGKQSLTLHNTNTSITAVYGGSRDNLLSSQSQRRELHVTNPDEVEEQPTRSFDDYSVEIPRKRTTMRGNRSTRETQIRPALPERLPTEQTNPTDV